MIKAPAFLVAALFFGLSANMVQAGVVGDFNDDGRINILDIVHMLNVIAGNKPQGDFGKRYVIEGYPDNSTGNGHRGEVIQGVEMVFVPSGSFVMGGTVMPGHNHGRWPSYMERAVMHAVGMDSLWVGRTEITRGMFADMMGFDHSQFNYLDSLPAHGLDWFDAARFCNALSEQAGFEACYDTTTWQVDFSVNGFRLPTEAEWEYAARAGSATLFFSGNEEDDLRHAGWYDGNSDGMVHSVGELTPNSWGLYDMMGNVAEWCNDWYDEQFYGSEYMNQPMGPESGERRVVRGGSYGSGYSFCGVAYRDFAEPDISGQPIGFRVVRNAGVD